MLFLLERMCGRQTVLFRFECLADIFSEINIASSKTTDSTFLSTIKSSVWAKVRILEIDGVYHHELDSFPILKNLSDAIGGDSQ